MIPACRNTSRNHTHLAISQWRESSFLSFGCCGCLKPLPSLQNTLIAMLTMPIISSLKTTLTFSKEIAMYRYSFGPSITWGLLSASGNGYRKPLCDPLRFDDWDVDMAGTKTNRDMFVNVFGLPNLFKSSCRCRKSLAQQRK